MQDLRFGIPDVHYTPDTSPGSGHDFLVPRQVVAVARLFRGGVLPLRIPDLLELPPDAAVALRLA